MTEDLRATELVPLYDRMIVDPDEVPDETKSGLFLPGVARAKPDTGVVVACGPGRLDNFGVTHRMPVNVGERVMFAPHSGVEINVDDGTYLIVNSGDILAVVRDASARAEMERAELADRKGEVPGE